MWSNIVGCTLFLFWSLGQFRTSHWPKLSSCQYTRIPDWHWGTKAMFLTIPTELIFSPFYFQFSLSLYMHFFHTFFFQAINVFLLSLENVCLSNLRNTLVYVREEPITCSNKFNLHKAPKPFPKKQRPVSLRLKIVSVFLTLWDPK